MYTGFKIKTHEVTRYDIRQFSLKLIKDSLHNQLSPTFLQTIPQWVKVKSGITQHGKLCSLTWPDLKSVLSDGTETAAGNAGEAGGGGGKLRVWAAETLWGVHGAEAEAGVPDHEGHDGQRVRAAGKDPSLMVFQIYEMFYHLVCQLSAP